MGILPQLKTRKVVACTPPGVAGSCTICIGSSEDRAKPLLWAEQQAREVPRSWPSPHSHVQKACFGQTVFLHPRKWFPSKLGFRLHCPRKWRLIPMWDLSVLTPAVPTRDKEERGGCPKERWIQLLFLCTEGAKGPGAGFAQMAHVMRSQSK